VTATDVKLREHRDHRLQITQSILVVEINAAQPADNPARETLCPKRKLSIVFHLRGRFKTT
jgi:hypothetical protein